MARITQDGQTREEIFESNQKFKSELMEEINTIKPDIAVVDLLTVAGFEVCEEMGIQVVCNVPMPV